MNLSPPSSTLEFFTLKCRPRRELRISSARDDQMGAKISTPKKTPTASNKPKTISGPKINPQKYPMPNFQALKKATKQGWWYFICRTMPLGIRGCHHKSSDCFEYPKNNYFNQATQKNTLQISLPPTQSQNRRPETQKSHSIIPITWNPEYPPPPRSIAKEGWGESWDACDTH